MVDKSKVQNILVITLSNIGDVVLTLPVISVLRKEFPGAQLSVMVGPRAKGVFDGDPRLARVIVYEKHLPFKHKIRFALGLRKQRFDLVVDLKNTLFPFLLGARYKTGPLPKAPKSISHMRDRHLWKLKSLGIAIQGYDASGIWISPEDENYISRFLEDNAIDKSHALVALNPGGRNAIKRWSAGGFACLSDALVDAYGAKIIIVGDEEEQALASEIAVKMKNKPIIASGKTSIRQTACLLKRCKLLISNDSAPLHIAASVNTPILAIFGPTDANMYGPTGRGDIVVKRDLPCAPCREAACRQNHECMDLITPDEVFAAAKKILGRQKYE